MESVVFGNPNAKITITEFTDFQCPHCAEAAILVNEILKKYPKDVKVVIKNSPLSFHKQAYKRLSMRWLLMNKVNTKKCITRFLKTIKN